MTSREDKIQALKDLMAGRISTSQLPKPVPDNSAWHYDGTVFIRLDPATKKLHPSGLQLTEEAFCRYAIQHPNSLHMVLDSCSMEVGNFQAFEVYDETLPIEAPASQNTAKVIKIGVKLPLNQLVPVKASQWQALGLL